MKNKKLITTLSIIFAVLSALSLYLFIPYKTNSVPTKATEDTRIISYNLKNAYSQEDQDLMYGRIEFIARQILSYDADVIGLQEADSPWLYDGANDWQDEGLPYYLSSKYDYFEGNVRSDSTWEYAPIFWNKAKYTLVGSGSEFLSDTPDEPSYTWGSTTFYRVLNFVVLEEISSGKQITVFNTHLDSESKESREKSVQVILNRTGAVNMPCFITGDFNFNIGSKNYDALIDGGLKDSKHTAKNTMQHGTINYFLNFNTHIFPIIDFVLYKGEKIVTNNYFVDNTFRFNGKPASDHYPVVSDFKIS